MRFLDTNTILRYVVAPRSPEDERKHHACVALFVRVRDGEEVVATCEAVFTESIYVLCSPRQYNCDRSLAVELVRSVFELPGVRIPNKVTYLRALDVFEQHASLDIEDALCVAHMERLGLSEIISYDRDFDRVAGIVRVEPPAHDARSE